MKVHSNKGWYSPSNLWYRVHSLFLLAITGLSHLPDFILWASCQILKIAGCACVGNAGNVFPSPRVSHPDMHHGSCETHVPWCMPGSLTSGLLLNRWRGKRSRHSRRMRKPQVYVSGKRPMGVASHNKPDHSYFMSFHIDNIMICTKTEIFFTNSIKISLCWITQSASPSSFVTIVYTLTKTFAKHVNICTSFIAPNISKPKLKPHCSYGSYYRYQCWFSPVTIFNQYFKTLMYRSILMGTLSNSPYTKSCFLYAKYPFTET